MSRPVLRTSGRHRACGAFASLRRDYLLDWPCHITLPMIVVSPGQGSVELAAPAQTILSQWFTWMLLFRSHGPLPQRLSLDPLHCILIVWIDYGVCGDLRVSVSRICRAGVALEGAAPIAAEAGGIHRRGVLVSAIASALRCRSPYRGQVVACCWQRGMSRRTATRCSDGRAGDRLSACRRPLPVRLVVGPGAFPGPAAAAR